MSSHFFGHGREESNTLRQLGIRTGYFCSLTEVTELAGIVRITVYEE